VLQASGWQAQILQHEYDHIRGTLYMDRMHSRTFVHASVMPTQGLEAAVPLGSCSCSCSHQQLSMALASIKLA
jgi:hypothetical protein